MSDQNKARESLAEAAYFYGECNMEMEQVHSHAQRAEELARGMGTILLTLHQRWSGAAQRSQGNIEHADEIVSHMNDSLKAMEPLYADIHTTLAARLLMARQNAEAIRNASQDMQAAVTLVPLEELKGLSSQIMGDADSLGRYAASSAKVWQSCDFAAATCDALRETL